MQEPKLKTYMTPFPHSVDLKAPLGEARKLMMQYSVRHLPVTHDQKISGIVSDRDIKLLLGPEIGYPDPHALVVEDAYVKDCYLVDSEHSLKSVLKYMADHHIGSAVVTSQGRLVGIFTMNDACRAFADHLETHQYA